MNDPSVFMQSPIRLYLVADPNLCLGLPHIWVALDRIKSYSSKGRQLINHLERSRIPVQEQKMGCVAGLFNAKARYPGGGSGPLLSLNPDFSAGYERWILHEVFHSYQHVHYNLFRQNADLNLRESILHALLLEAGAETMSAAICYEMKTNGHAKPFDDAKSVLSRYQSYARLYQIFEKNVLENEDHPFKRKLAATQVFNAYFQCADLVSIYAQGVIGDYVQDIHSGAFKNAPAEGNTAERAREFCADQIDDIELPKTDDDLFVGNKRLRQLAAWAEYTRWHQHEGDSHFVRQERAKLERDGNPFMEIKLADLCERLRPPMGYHALETRPVLDIACKMAGLDDTKKPRSQSFNQRAGNNDASSRPERPRRRSPQKH